MNEEGKELHELLATKEALEARLNKLKITIRKKLYEKSKHRGGSKN